MLPGDDITPSGYDDSSRSLPTLGWAEKTQKVIAAPVDWEAHLEALPLATWIGGASGDHVFVNRAYCRLLGVLDKDDVTNRGWQKHIYWDDRADYIRHWNNFVRGLAPRFKETVRWVRPDTGEVILLAVLAQKLDCGQFQGWIRRATMEQALQRLEEISRGH